MVPRRVRRQITSAFCGLLLLIAGLLAAYWWFYRLGPVRKIVDPIWLAEHSEVARWKEEQKDYRRMGSSPDLCFRGDRIGFYGDRKWFLWLADQLGHTDFRSCGCTKYALALMANRHVDAWRQWAETNRSRSQEEWIRDGFSAFGLTVHLPPVADDTLPLLRLLGRPCWNFLWAGPQGTNAPEAIPSFAQYNAYRWLRDSGFELGKFMATNGTLFAHSDIASGLVGYSRWMAAYPGEQGLGVLALRSTKSDDWGGRPLLTAPWFVVAVNGGIVLMMLGGLLLLVRAIRSRAVESWRTDLW